MKNSFTSMLTITAISAAGTNFNFFRNSTLVQAINIIKEITVIITDPN